MHLSARPGAPFRDPAILRLAPGLLSAGKSQVATFTHVHCGRRTRCRQPREDAAACWRAWISMYTLISDLRRPFWQGFPNTRWHTRCNFFSTFHKPTCTKTCRYRSARPNLDYLRIADDTGANRVVGSKGPTPKPRMPVCEKNSATTKTRHYSGRSNQSASCSSKNDAIYFWRTTGAMGGNRTAMCHSTRTAISTARHRQAERTAMVLSSRSRRS